MIFPRVYSKFDREAIQKKRLITVGSPTFPISCGNIAVGGRVLVGFESNKQHRKYLPLNWLRIVNDSGVDLKVYMGQKDAEILKNNSIYTKEGNFYSFLLENIGSSEALETNIHIHVQRKPTGV